MAPAASGNTTIVPSNLFPNNGLHAQLYARQMELMGFHEYLLRQVEYLPEEKRWSLAVALNNQGWPLHLRSMASANWELEADRPWAREDYEALKIIADHGVKAKEIVSVFFEGRSISEIEEVLDMLKTGIQNVPVYSIEEVPPEPKTQRTASARVVPSNGTPSSALVRSPAPPTTPSAATPSRKHHMTALPMTPLAATPSNKRKHMGDPSPTALARPSVPTPFKRQLIDSPSIGSRSRSETPDAKSGSKWDEADSQLIWNAVQYGLDARQVQIQFLPFRSISAIQTRMALEWKAHGIQNTVNRWSKKDDAKLLNLGDEGQGFEEIAPRLSRERTPQLIEARYSMLKQKKVSGQAAPDPTLFEDGNEKRESDVRMVDLEGDNDPRYTEGTPTPMSHAAPQTPKNNRPTTARKTAASGGAPTEKPMEKPMEKPTETPTSTPNKTPRTIQCIRNQLFKAIDNRHLSEDKKSELRKALGKGNWPTRFTSVATYNSEPLPKKGSRWSDQDSKALRCIKDAVPKLPHTVLASFFPGRSDTAIRHHYNMKIKPFEKK